MNTTGFRAAVDPRMAEFQRMMALRQFRGQPPGVAPAPDVAADQGEGWAAEVQKDPRLDPAMASNWDSVNRRIIDPSINMSVGQPAQQATGMRERFAGVPGMEPNVTGTTGPGSGGDQGIGAQMQGQPGPPMPGGMGIGRQMGRGFAPQPVRPPMNVMPNGSGFQPQFQQPQPRQLQPQPQRRIGGYGVTRQ